MSDALLDQTEISRAATQLLEARTEHFRVDEPEISSQGSAYAIQVEIARRAGGLKTWKAALLELGGDIIFAPILDGTVANSGMRFPSGYFNMIGLEGEVAFRLAHKVSPAKAALHREDMPELIAEAYPAIEIVDTRLRDWEGASDLARIADNMSSGGLVVGDPLPDWRSLDLSAPGFQLKYNGEVIGPAGSNKLGDLLDVLHGFLAHCRSMGLELPEGTLISTGSCTGLSFVSQPGTATLEFEHHELVTCEFG